MALTFIGRETFNEKTTTWSLNATLPTNTTFVTVSIQGFSNNIQTISSITLGGSAMTFQVSDATDAGYNQSFLYTQYNTAGVKAFACTTSHSWAKGGFGIFTYWSGVHPTIPVRQALANHSTLAAHDQVDLLFTTEINDVLVVTGTGYNDEAIDVDIGGQIKIYEDSVAYQTQYSAAAYESATPGETTMSVAGWTPSAAGLVMIPTVQPPGVNVGRIWTYNEDMGESGTGYRNVGYWTETLGASCVLDEDYSTVGLSGAPVTWGAQCLRAYSSAGGNAKLEHDFSADPIPTTYWRFEFILSSLPTGGTIFNLTDAPLNNICSFVVSNASPTFTLTPTFDGIQRTPETGLVLNHKYCIEVIWDTVYQIWQWKLDQVTMEGGAPSTAGALAYAWIGMSGGGSSDIFIDNYWADYTEWVGAVPKTYLVAHTGVVGGATTPAIDTTNAKLLVAVGYHWTTSSMTITDSKGNTWRPLTVRGNASTGYGMIAYSYDKAGAALSVGSGHTFSVTTETKQSIIVQAWGGNNPVVDPFISETGNTVSSSTTIQPGAILPDTIDDLMISFEGAPSPINETPTIDKGFLITDSYHDGTNQGGSMAYWLITNQNPMNPTWTHVTSSNYVSGMAMFKQIALNLYKVSTWPVGMGRWS